MKINNLIRLTAPICLRTIFLFWVFEASQKSYMVYSIHKRIIFMSRLCYLNPNYSQNLQTS